MVDFKTFTSQMQAPCIGGPANGMRIALRPKVRPSITIAEDIGTGMPRETVYLAEVMVAGTAEIFIYRPAGMSVEHALYHLVAEYPTEEHWQ